MLIHNTSQALIQFIEAIGTGGVLAILLGSTGLGGIVTGYIAWKKVPVERRDADLVVAEKSQTMSLALASELRTELTRMGDRIGKLEERLTKETQRGDQLEIKVRDQDNIIFTLRVYISRVTDWWAHHIVANWDLVRTQDQPPIMPKFEEVR